MKNSKYGHFVISYLDKQSAGSHPYLKVEATASFIHTLQTTTFDDYYTGSRTAVEFFRILSEQSGIQHTVQTFREAFGWEKFGEGVHNIKEFNRAVKNYGYVYEPVSEHEIALKDRIGRDVQYVIKNAMNANNMKLSIDRSEVYTQVDGYADFEEEGDFYETAKVTDQYTSGLADIIGFKRADDAYDNSKKSIRMSENSAEEIKELKTTLKWVAGFAVSILVPFILFVLGFIFI